jgi:cytochrome c556
VPLDQQDFQQWTRELRQAAEKMYKTLQTKNREQASEATNDVAGACENCHTKYRDVAEGKPRCTP